MTKNKIETATKKDTKSKIKSVAANLEASKKVVRDPQDSGLSASSDESLENVGLSLVHRMEIMKPPNKAATKTQPGTLGRQVDLDTNLYAMKPDAGLTVHRYEVAIQEMGLERAKEVTRGAANDYFMIRRRELCYFVFHVLAIKQTEFFRDFFALVYDRNHALFSKTELCLPRDGKSFVITKEEVAIAYKMTVAEFDKRFELKDKMTGFEVLIKPTLLGRDYRLRLDDFRKVITPDLLRRDRSVVQILELAVTQNILYNPNLISYGESFFDAKPGKSLGSGTAMRMGLQKSVKVIGTAEAPKTVLQVDSKMMAFYKSQQVLCTVSEVLGIPPANFTPDCELDDKKRGILNKYFRELAIEADEGNGKSRKFECDGLAFAGAHATEIKHEGNVMTVVEYYKVKYGMELRFPKLCCLVEKPPQGHRKFYPMEVCTVMDYQRVEIKKQLDGIADNMIKESALPPARRKQLVNECIAGCNLIDNPHLQHLGITIDKTSLQVKGRVLQAPEVLYKSASDAPLKANVTAFGNWNVPAGAKFDKAASLDAWMVLVLKSKKTQQIPLVEAEVLEFMAKFYKQATDLGMKLGNHAVRVCGSEPEALKLEFGVMQRDAIKLVLVITEDKAEKAVHDGIKYNEMVHQVLTQHILAGTVGRIIGKGKRPDGKVLENVVLKANTKLGGVNHKLVATQKYIEEKMMVFGLDVNHPPPLAKKLRQLGKKQEEPSVIGICANTKADPFEGITGDYRFQNTRVEVDEGSVKKLGEVVGDLLDKYKANTGYFPKKVVMFRDGVSKGQYEKVMAAEAPQLRLAMAERKMKAELTFIVVIKTHNTRFYPTQIDPNAKAGDQNVKPGTVVDKDVVHPVDKEFFLTSHKTIQGTARTPCYVALVDDGDMAMDELERLTYDMAFGHAIVNSPVSIPAHCYTAHELAKRGKANYTAHMVSIATSSSSGLGSSEEVEVDVATSQEKKLAELNSGITYKGKPLGAIKYNA